MFTVVANIPRPRIFFDKLNCILNNHRFMNIGNISALNDDACKLSQFQISCNCKHIVAVSNKYTNGF